MSAVVLDIETNGLNPDTIWCVSDSAGLHSTSGYSFEEGNEYYAHNGIGFDYPVLRDLWGLELEAHKARLKDTMVLSRLANPSRPGGHSLENWGSILGVPKTGHEDWSQYSPEMKVRCDTDVTLTERVLRALEGELEGFSDRSKLLEHQVAWIIQEQVDNGWMLNEERVFLLLAELKEKKFELEDKVREVFQPFCQMVREVTPKTKKDGNLSIVGLKCLGENALDIVGGPFTLVDYPEFNLGSRQQIATYLQRFGWVPTKFTPTTPKGGGGNPIVDETVLKDVQGIPEATLIADYLTVQRRIAMAQSWLDAVTEDGRVHGKVNSNGAVTGRMTHYEPNLGQVTAGTKIYGPEMRDCWVVPEGRKLVGVDASGLELRMLAHYMNDDEYIQEILHGDIHTANQRAAGLVSRDTAKTFIYAFLYGAGDAKIGSIVGGSRAEGRQLKQRFLQNTPSLASLRDRVAQAARRGWLAGLDGRRIAVRSPHAALNTLLQGAGAVVMKQALVNLHRFATAQRMDFKLVGNIHDEVQAEVLTAQAQKFGALGAYAIQKAGEDFNLRIALAGKYKIGDSWKETH